ncbi:MAG: N-acetyltransferase family protein [Actinomycetota bacterium]
MSVPAGSALRPVDPDADLDAVSGLYLACDLADVGEPDHQRDWIAESWRSPSHVGAWIARDPTGDVAACVELDAVDPSSSLDAFTPVRPDLREGPLRAALLAFVEERARDAAAGSSPRLFVSGAQTDPTFGTDAVAAGFAKVRTFWHMQRDVDLSLDPGRVPPGLTIRPSVAGDDDHAVFVVLDAAFRGHFGIDPMPEEAWREEFLGMRLYDPSLVLIAEEDGQAVGVAAGFLPDGLGWVGDLGVLESHRGRGIGAALLRASFAALAARGATQVRLNVDAENETGAPHLYASVGMTVRRAFDVYEKRLGDG